MAFTVEKMLLLKEFEGCKLVAGAAGLDHVIECVDTMEIPNIEPWIKKNELLLTTGYSIINRMDLLLSLLDILYKNDSAGLAIKTRFIGPLPKLVIDRANTYKLPIIEMPDGAPFIPLINAIGNCIADERHSMLLFTLSVTQRFSNLQHADNFFQEICLLIHSYIELPVIITDYLLLPYSSYPNNNLIPALHNNERVRFLNQKLADLENLDILDSQFPDQPTLILQKIHIHSVLAGYIFLLVSNNSSHEIQEKCKIVLEQAASALALYLSDSNIRNSQYRQQDAALYRKLLSENLSESGIVNHWIRQYNWPTPPIYLLTFYTPTLFRRSASDSLNSQIIWVIRSLLFGDNIPCTLIYHEDCIRCIIPAISREKLLTDLRLIIQKLLTDLKLNLTVTVSDPLDGYQHLADTHAEALHTLKIAEKLKLDIAFTQDLTFELALLQGADNQYLRRFTKDILGKLIEYDQQNNTYLLQTLQALVDHMGVHTQAAKALYLHRNTLLYRIHRIESLTGLDLSRSEDLYRAGTALRIRLLLEVGND